MMANKKRERGVGAGLKPARTGESGFNLEAWGDADFAMADYAFESATLAKIRAGLEDTLASIRASYQLKIFEHEERLKATEAALEQFADSRKAEFKAAPDGDGRSYEHAGVSIGFRKLLDKVALPRGDAKKEVSLEYLAQYRPEFVRRTPEFDLMALLPALKDGSPDVVKALAEHGITLKVGKDEFFLKVT
jgi:hypothetical protein